MHQAQGRRHSFKKVLPCQMQISARVEVHRNTLLLQRDQNVLHDLKQAATWFLHFGCCRVLQYRGTSLKRNCHPQGSYSRPMVVLGGEGDY